MKFFNDLLSNEIFISAATAWLIAQILKTLIHAFLTKDFDLERMYGSGGMPSSHSSTVTALATSCYLVHGAASSEFAIALILAIIVMYDARGVRRETGIQAKVLNNLMELLADIHNELMPIDEKLKEFVGHTPLQVVAGAFLGLAIACTIHLFY
ncbi:MAG: divergent PAP2 family protein [Lachnospiraceae bacterium]|nr:divergent PAP2 family protein [Lachnospiraceae bacterium]